MNVSKSQRTARVLTDRAGMVFGTQAFRFTFFAFWNWVNLVRAWNSSLCVALHSRDSLIS